jgi:hypothetical protein
MTVYVDDMYLRPMGRLGRMKMSHMIADTEAELHAMAAAIGLARRHYQGDHYDVSKGLRAKAIEHGACAVTLRQLSAMGMLRRWGEPMGTPETAIERMVRYSRQSDDAKKVSA